jgi:hypothetical protein
MPAIVSIIAKIIVLVDAALESFVTLTPVSENYSGGVCAPVILASVTACGAQLADLWEKAIYQVSGLVVEVMAALGANVSPTTGWPF